MMETGLIKKIEGQMKKHWIIIIITIVFSVLVLSRLGRDLLSDWDECIYTEYARAMQQTGDFLTHQWNGSYTLEKPPLYSWIQQIPFLFSINEFTARLPTAIFGLLLILTVYHFGRRFFSSAVGIMAVLLLLSSEVVVRYMTRANTDIGYTFFIFAGLPEPFINAIVPTVGFVLSTLSVPIFKKLWLKGKS